MNSKAEWSA